MTERFVALRTWLDSTSRSDESYSSERYKAHGLIADELRRYMLRDAPPVVRAWLDGVSVGR